MPQRRVLRNSRRLLFLFFLAVGFTGVSDFPTTVWSKDNRAPDLIRAVRDGERKKVDKLIERNSDINVRDDYGWTPLMYAIFRGDSGLVDRLLSHGANVNLQDQDGVSPLIASIMHMPLPFMVQYLSESDKRAKDIPLLLLEKGADPNCADNDGNTPLIYAVVRDQVSAMEALIKKGADPNRPDRFGRTALYFVENPDKVKEWAPADGVLSSQYRIRRESDESNFPAQYAAKVAAARAQANIMLKEIRARVVELLKSAGATAPDAQKIHAIAYRVDSAPQRLDFGPRDPLNAIMMNYFQMNRQNAAYHILVCVTPDGKVKKAIVLRGADGLSEELQKAVLKMKFQPAIKDGRPIEIWDAVTGFSMGR